MKTKIFLDYNDTIITETLQKVLENSEQVTNENGEIKYARKVSDLYFFQPIFDNSGRQISSRKIEISIPHLRAIMAKVSEIENSDFVFTKPDIDDDLPY